MRTAVHVPYAKPTPSQSSLQELPLQLEEAACTARLVANIAKNAGATLEARLQAAEELSSKSCPANGPHAPQSQHLHMRLVAVKRARSWWQLIVIMSSRQTRLIKAYQEHFWAT